MPGRISVFNSVTSVISIKSTNATDLSIELAVLKERVGGLLVILLQKTGQRGGLGVLGPLGDVLAWEEGGVNCREGKFTKSRATAQSSKLSLNTDSRTYYTHAMFL